MGVELSQLEAAKKKREATDGDPDDEAPQVLSDRVGKSGKRQIVRAPRAVRPVYAGNKPMNRFNIAPGMLTPPLNGAPAVVWCQG